MRVLFIALLIGLAGFSGSLWHALHQPWLGLELAPAPTGTGLVVAGVDAEGAAAGTLAVGDRLLAIAAEGGAWMHLQPGDLVVDPEEHPRFSDYNRFLQRQNALNRILHADRVRLRLGDGRELLLHPFPETPWRAIASGFWTCQVFALLTLMISTAVWSLQRRSLATRLLLGSGIGLFVGAVSASLYLGRELALDGETFRWLSVVNLSGNRLFAVAGLALLCLYPVEVAPRSRVLALAALEGAQLVNLIAQWLEPPLHAYYFDFLLLACLALFIALRAWLCARTDPLHRATLKVLLLPILVSVALVMAVYILPTILTGAPLMDVSGSYMLLLIMYAGLAFGVARYRLFDIERWWVTTWLWFLLGLAIMGLDFLVITLLHWRPETSLAVSLLLVSWLYFPLRQRLWERLLHRRTLSMETCLSELVSHFVRPGSEEDDLRFWQRLLQRAFLPASMEIVTASADQVRLSEDGTRLRVPLLGADHSVELRLPDRGARLFNREDAQLAQSLLALAQRARAQRQAYLLGREDERRRIMRDLHDDVGGRLLTLLHASQDRETRNLAREALDSLREVIHFTLEEANRLALGDLLGRWRAQLRERLDRAGVQLCWSWDDACDRVQLAPRDALNLGRILYEATSNALRHAAPRSLAIEGRLKGRELVVRLTNDGADGAPGDTHSPTTGGRGKHNIRTRAEELGGRATFHRDGERFILDLRLPMETLDEKGPDTRGS